MKPCCIPTAVKTSVPLQCRRSGRPCFPALPCLPPWSRTEHGRTGPAVHRKRHLLPLGRAACLTGDSRGCDDLLPVQLNGFWGRSGGNWAELPRGDGAAAKAKAAIVNLRRSTRRSAWRGFGPISTCFGSGLLWGVLGKRRRASHGEANAAGGVSPHYPLPRAGKETGRGVWQSVSLSMAT